jgi:hypothetical protein
MTRSQWLDQATEEDKQQDILKTISEAGALRIYGKQAAAFWVGAINALEVAGKVKVTEKGSDTAQETYWLVEPA